MDSRLAKLMAKKKGAEMSPIEKEAKMGVVGDLRKMASDAMGDRLKGLQKVTVAAPDKSGLSEGLEKAQEMIGDGSQMPDEESMDHESEESPEMEASEDEHLSEDEIDEKLQHLMQLKEHMQAKKGRI